MLGIRAAAACLIEARPVVQAVFLMRFLAGALLADPGYVPHPGRVAAGAAGWFCSTVAIYVFNGIADRAEDVANGSRRPIASGRLLVPYAGRAVVVLAVLGFCCAWWLGTSEGVCSTVFLALGYCYSGPPYPLKKNYYAITIGGVALGLVTYLAGSAAAGTGVSPTFVVFAGAMSLWMGGVGGIAKDLSDVEGDRAAGRRTLPIVAGEGMARRLLAVVAGGVAVSFASVAAVGFGSLVWCAAAVVLGAVGVGWLSMSSATWGSRTRRRLPYRAFMWTQHATHVVLAVSLWATAL